MNDIKVSVVIPVYQPNIEQLKEQVELLLSQNIAPTEIIIIHTSLGEDLGIVKNMPKVKYIGISKEEFDHGKTRDMGVKESIGDYVVFLTQDAHIVDSYLIEELTMPFENKRVAITYGRQMVGPKGSLIEKFTREFNYPKEDKLKGKDDINKLGIKTYFCSDVCSCYKKSVYLTLGGFPTPAIFNEDMVMAYETINNDYLVYYASHAKVIHSHNYTNKQQFKRNFDLGVSQSVFYYVFESVSSEKEGASYAKTLVFKLIRMGKFDLIFKFIVSCLVKYVGFTLGKHYKRLPKKVIMKCTASPNYFIKHGRFS